MFWAILLIAAVICVVRFPAFRKSMLIIIGALVVVLGVYFAAQSQEESASKRRVTANQLELTDMSLQPEGHGSSYKLTGRIKNKSSFAVYQVKARITMRDCDKNSHCETVGEEEEWDISPLVPPGQVRDIDHSVYFPESTRILGRWEWSYSILEIRARPEIRS